MKIRQKSTVTSPKHNKKLNCQTENHSLLASKSPNRHNSAINLKLAKEQSKTKKENKEKKVDTKLEDKKTKRKQRKRQGSELNSTIILKECVESRQSRKEEATQSKLKNRTCEKYCRLSSKIDNKNTLSCDWLSAFMQENTVTESLKDKKRKSVKKEETKFTLPNEEYLFIGQDFYHVDKFCPTKRIINTFRDICSSDNFTQKFVPQDKNDKPARIDLKKSNIFTNARKQIQFKEKSMKAVMIQRWWRKIFKVRFCKVEDNPQQQLQQQFYQNTQQKVNFEEQSIDQLRSPFEIEQLNQSPIPNKTSNHQDSIIASFNSVQSMQEHPKKIQLTKENLTNLLNHQYKLPEEHEVNSEQNEQIFSNYSQFQQKQSEKIEQIKQQSKEKVVFRSAITESQSMDIFKEFEQANRIKEMIEMRIIQQKGHIRSPDSSNTKISIHTNIISIHSFLIKFFNFYIQKHRQEFINLINMPYGNSIPARMRHLHGEPLPEQEDQDDEGIIYGLTKIIDQDKVSEFYDYLQRSEPNKSHVYSANLELERTHNQAVIDYFNQQLNTYRPYKEINGVPYPWNNTYKALTFYFVTEDNIAQIFEKTQIAILKSCSTLTGIHLPLPQLQIAQINPFQFDLVEWMQQYETKTHGMILEYNEDKEMKQMHEDIKKDSFQIDIQIHTGLLMDAAKSVFNHLTAELVLEMANMGLF